MYAGFARELLQLIRCPDDGAPLLLDAEGDGPVRCGTLTCDRCETVYPVENGILNLLVHQDFDPVSAHEIKARDEDAGNYHNYCTKIGDRKEIPSTLAMMAGVAGKRVVELGCGTGRYSVRLGPEAAQFIGVDFSIHSLAILAAALPAGGSTGLVLADATRFRTAKGHFDLVLCAQLLQHVPSRAMRDELYRNVAAQLRSGGVFVCNAYHYHLSLRLLRQAREGRHESGIFYHRFTRGELTDEIGCHLEVSSARPISIHLPFSGTLRLNDVWLSRKIESVPLVNALGALMLVKAEKRQAAPKEN